MLGKTIGVSRTIEDTMVLHSPKFAQFTPKFIIPLYRKEKDIGMS